MVSYFENTIIRKNWCFKTILSLGTHEMIYSCNRSDIKKLNNSYRIYYYKRILYFIKNY